MKQKLKIYLKLGILIFGLSLFLTNCQKNDDPASVEETISEASKLLSGIKGNRVQLSDLVKDETINNVLQKSLQNRKQKLSEKKGISDVAISSFDELELAESVTKYTLNNYTSYTIPVKKDNDEIDSFQNLVIESDNIRDAVYLITYFPDTFYQESIKLGYTNETADLDYSGARQIEYLYYKDQLKDNTVTKGTMSKSADDINTEDESSSDAICTIIYEPGRNCIAGGDHAPDEASECQGNNSSSGPVQPYVYLICANVPGEGGGSSGGSGITNTDGTDLTGAIIGIDGGDGNGDHPIDWVPEYICMNSDCSVVEPYVPIITTPTTDDVWNDDNFGSQINELLDNELSPLEVLWLYDNPLDAKNIFDFLNENGNSTKAKDFAKWEIEFEMLPTEPCGINHDCIKSIKTMAAGLKRFHGEDGKLMADYLESLIADYNSFSLLDLQVFYNTAYAITTEYNSHMRSSIMLGFVKGIQPIVEIALFEVGGTVAIKLLSKLPAIAKTLKIAEVLNNLKITNSLSKFKYAQKFGFKSYTEHVKFFKDMNISRSELGVEVHHLFEKRFSAIFNINPDKMKSVVLTVAEHGDFTKLWRSKIPYTTATSSSNALHTATATKAQVEAAAREIYKNYPDILNVLGL